MRVGIFGAEGDAQADHVARELGALGADVVLIRADALDVGLPLSKLGGRTFYQGAAVDDLQGFYLRAVPSAQAPCVQEDGELRLHADWYARSMQQRERSHFFIAWLLELQQRQVRLVNPPHAASVVQFKPFQLHALRTVGARVPRTLISNDPAAVRAFHSAVAQVIYKPLTGGAHTRVLDDQVLDAIEAVRDAPVIFQERVDGDDLRVMLAGDDIVSSVAIRTPKQHLDFRADPVYATGEASYEEIRIPDEVQVLCRRAARMCGLAFAGIDIKRTPAGEWIFLELNSSPIYLDVELKLGHPISRAIAELVVGTRAFS